MKRILDLYFKKGNAFWNYKLKDNIPSDCLYAFCPDIVSYTIAINNFRIPETNLFLYDNSYGSYTDWINMIIKEKKLIGMFDVITGNPPYDKSLHLKIINSALPCLKPNGTARFIHPAGWLYNPDKYELSKHFKVLHYYSQNESFDLFNVTVHSGLIISEFKDEFKHNEYNELYSRYNGILEPAEIDFLKEIKTKILTQKGYDTWSNHIVEKDPDTCPRCVTVSQVVGGSNGRSMKLNHKNVCHYILNNGIIEKGDNNIGDRFSDVINSLNKHSYTLIETDPDKIYDYSKNSYTSALQDVLFRYGTNPMYSKYLWMNEWTDDEYYNFFNINNIERDKIETIINKLINLENTK